MLCNAYHENVKFECKSCCHFERSEKSLGFKHLHNSFLFAICRKQHIAAICGFKRFLATLEMTTLLKFVFGFWNWALA